MKEIVKEIYSNHNQNNTNGVFMIDNKKIFYKILNNSLFESEITGYKKISKYYRTPIKFFEISNRVRNIIGYEYNNNVGKNKGLLLDYFITRDKLDSLYYNIMNKYRDIFIISIKNTKKNSSKIFFEDRINTRLKDNYSNILIKLSDRLKNDTNIDDIYKSVKKYYKNSDRSKWCVISQCDPNDLNICIDGTIFDFTAGGYVPIMAEFATFFWYNLMQCEYLSPKYNFKAFREHKIIYKKMKKYNFVEKKTLKIHIRPIRLDAIIYYMEKVISPVISKIEYEDWYLDFKNYLAMKALAVFNFKDMKKFDIILTLKYLSLFYSLDFKNFKDFIIFIKDWRNVNDKLR